MILRFESQDGLFRLRARQAVVSAARTAPTGCSAMVLNVRSIGHGAIEAEPPPGDNPRQRVVGAAGRVASNCRKSPAFGGNCRSAPRRAHGAWSTNSRRNDPSVGT